MDWIRWRLCAAVICLCLLGCEPPPPDFDTPCSYCGERPAAATDLCEGCALHLARP